MSTLNNSECTLAFSSRLKSLLKYRKMTQSELSIKLNLPFSTLNGYTRGKRMPSIDIVKQICDLLNCNFDYIFDTNAIYPSAIFDLVDSKEYDLDYIGDILHIESGVLYGWAYGQFRLNDIDYENIAELLGVTKEYLDTLTENLHWTISDLDNNPISKPTLTTKLQQLSLDELDDVEKYIDFIISKRKS